MSKLGKALMGSALLAAAALGSGCTVNNTYVVPNGAYRPYVYSMPSAPAYPWFNEFEHSDMGSVNGPIFRYRCVNAGCMP